MSRPPDATVCIPWRPTPSRIPLYKRIRRFWAEYFPDWPVVTADSDSEVFSLSQARNNAVRKARTDIVVMADADTIPPVDSLIAAVNEPVGITWPHKTWRLIPGEWINKPIENLGEAPTLLEYPQGLGGVIVCTADEYWRLGGQDERFAGWGFEDCAFQLVALTLSSFRRIGGIAYAFEHNDEYGIADSPGWDRGGKQNKLQFEHYRLASNRPWVMRELLKTRYEEESANNPLVGRYSA